MRAPCWHRWRTPRRRHSVISENERSHRVTDAAESQSLPYRLWQETPAGEAPFVVCALFTKSYQAKAKRLAASARKFKLPYALFEVPHVHRSISVRGADDIAFSKPRFISFALRRFERAILYLDADCYFSSRPDLIAGLCSQHVDFAIYNWFADHMNDAWVPIEDRALNRRTPARFWRYSRGIDFFSTTQLCCSGCAQFWNNSPASQLLLNDWESTLCKFPRSPDDHCLDYAFNLTSPGRNSLRYHWLSKEYARYAFWIYVRPIINHPDMPSASAPDHFESLEEKRFDASQVRMSVGKSRLFPRDGIIDADAKLFLMRRPDGQFAPVSRIDVPLYIGTSA